MRLIKTSLLSLLTLTTCTYADVSVMQYNAATGVATSYNIPLEEVTYIIGNGKFAFAVDHPISHSVTTDNPVIVSMFDGNKWSNPISTDTSAEGGAMQTYSNGDFAIGKLFC